MLPPCYMKRKGGQIMPTDAQLKALEKARAAQKKKKAEPVVEEQPKLGEAGIKELIQNDEKVKFFLQDDPLNPQVKTWERSFNGHMICLEVGRVYELPKFIVDFISDHLMIQRMSAETYADYASDKGKNLS